MEQLSILLEESHRTLRNEDILFYLYESEDEENEYQEEPEYELLQSEADNDDDLLQRSVYNWDTMFLLHDVEEMEDDEE